MTLTIPLWRGQGGGCRSERSEESNFNLNSMQENNKKNIIQNIGLYIFECVMALVYLAVSFILLFTRLFEDSISDNNVRLFLGILLGFYGIFRVYRAIRKYQKGNDANN